MLKRTVKLEHKLFLLLAGLVVGAAALVDCAEYEGGWREVAGY